MSGISAYQRTKVIGRGKFGVVYKGHHKHTKKVVAIKVLDLDTKYDEVVDVQQEIQFLSELRNAPNVTHYYGSFLDDTKLWIIMDYCEGGSMRTLLKAGVFEERHIGVIVREVLMALSAVHKIGVIHRDLKAANVLVTKEGHVQLCDFGVAAQLTATMAKRTTIAGTPFWMAPEVIREGDHYNSKADIWSLGITVYELATGNPPYCERNATWAMAMIEKQAPPRLEGREYPTALKEFIALCLDENPHERPSADDLFKCKLVKQYKSLPTSILKEVISRYLLWRDRHSSRDSILLSGDSEDDSTDAPDHISVKWDFDSLSSKEYIMTNDVHDLGPRRHDLEINQEESHDIMTAETLHFNYNAPDQRFNETITGMPSYHSSGFKVKTTEKSSSSVPLRTVNPNMDNASNVPKSLISLFEDDHSPEQEHFPPGNLQYDFPRLPNVSGPDSLMVSSPTIEIPDMDTLSQMGSEQKPHPQSSLAVSRSLSRHESSSDTYSKLSKPPVLSMQYGGSTNEGRHNSPTIGSRSRKKTISNSVNSISGGARFSQLDQQAPQTPPHITESMRKETPSPHSASESNLASSPSKSMRPLHSSNNPMLQPINFKLNSENITAKNISKSPIMPSPSTTINSLVPNHSSGTSSLPSNSSANLGKSHTKREKPSLRIQMPIPSTSHNLTSMLTREGSDSKRSDDNVNQFGINPALVSNFTSMTPVTEKENLMDEHIESRDLSSDNLAAHYRQKKSAMSGPKSAPLSGSFPTNQPSSGSLYRPHVLSNPRPLSAKENPRFPTILPLNGDIFMDSVPMSKLTNELENMVSLFIRGLETLENSL